MKIKTQIATKLFIAAIILFTTSCASQKKIVTDDEKKVYMQEVYTSLVTELSHEAEVAIVEDSIKVIFFNGISFSVNETVISNELYPYFERFAKVLNQYMKTTILITGHTDSTGDKKSNINLSQKRADSAKKLLQNLGVSRQRIYTLGHGSTLPIGDNTTSAGRAKNRRVEFILLYNY